MDKLKKSDFATSIINKVYSFKNLNEEIIQMETGIPIRFFSLIVDYARRFEDDIYYGRRVKSMEFVNQILIALIKLRQNYLNLHLAKFFS